MTPVPDTSVQRPVPTVMVFPVRVALVPQIFWSAPTNAGVGEAYRVMVTVSLLVAQPGTEIVHTKRLIPSESPETPEFAEFGLLTIPFPAIEVQVPVAVPVAAFPARVADAAQMN